MSFKRPKWETEEMQDNTGVINCKQCEDCRYRSDGTIYSNSFQKVSCQIYPYSSGASKPYGVIVNEEACEFKKAEK